jgi:hypothetical protein
MIEIFTSVAVLDVHVPRLPLAHRFRARGVEVAAAPDVPDHSRMP